MNKTMLSTFMTAGALAFATTSASAAPMGTLSITSGAEGVIVTATTIDFTPAGGGDGYFITSLGTNITYDFGVLTSGVEGTIKDLPPVPVNDFMTFEAPHTALSFDLSGLGPGSINTNCAALSMAGQSCSVFAGSPFVLTYLAPNVTTVSLFAFGNANDATGTSLWDGSFSTDIDMSAADIQALFANDPNAFIASGYSGRFTATFTPQVPEPASMLLLGLGFAAAAVGLRRRR